MGHLLTNPQNSIWLTEKFFKGTSVNNICGYVYIKDEVNFDVLKKSINELVKTNDSMRFKFKEENGSCVQYENNYEEFDIETFDFSSENDIEKKALEMANVPFNFENSFLFKFILFKLPNNSGGFIVNVHHIIGDSWTLGLIAKEVTGIYSAILNNTYEEKQFPSYINYINNENEYINSEKYIKDKAYWDEVFTTVPEVASIPSMKDNKNISHSCIGAREKFIVPEKEISKIKEVCANNKISIYNFFMAVYSLYLGRVSNLDDFVIGTPILNRTNFEQKHTMGMFISTAPLRINLDHELSFIYFSKNIASSSMSLLRHQRYPYQTILENLRKKDANIPNLYNVVLSYQITKTVEEENNIKYTTDWVFNGNSADELQIHLFDLHGEDSITVAYDYKSEKYDSQDIKDLHARILTVINQVIDNNEILLKNIEIVTPEEKHKILYEFNDTAVDYPRDKTIVDLFEEQVEKTPDNIAVVFEDQKLTYRELNEKANQLANYLIDNKISNNDVIALFFDKSLELIISILATLKVGATYLPLDIDYPEERISFILKDANAKIILSTSDYKNKLNFNLKTEYIDLLDISDKSTKFACKNTSPFDLAYIIYTSGSTGTPKGVMINNRSVVRLIKNTNYITFSPNDRILQTGSIVFDASTFEIWGALLNGLELYLLKKSDLLNPLFFQNYLLKNKISSLFLTTALFNKFCEENPKMFNGLKYLLTGGEAVSIKHMKIAKAENPNLNLVHVYGPTENTTFSTYYPVNEITDILPIGYPISNSTCYVVSKVGTLQPIGVPGELLVGGDGVADGYLNRKDLTAANFIHDTFNNEKIYKTGDLVKLLPDGNIDFIGRIDNQVKIRGFRIELSEIDSKILTYSGIKESISIIKEINDKKYICSYFVASKNINIDELKAYLKLNLPNYMIPNSFTQIDVLPLNINGKVDKKLLPEPTINRGSNIILPTNDIEKKILEALKSIISIENASVMDDFFDDLGLDSLNAMKLSSLLSDYSITIQDISTYSSIRSLANHINNVYSEDIKEENLPKTDIVNKNVQYDLTNVLLTGSIGFLGINVLYELINCDTVSKVYCLIRKKYNKSPYERLSSILDFYFDNEIKTKILEAVVIVDGDFVYDNLNLNNETYSDLINNVTTVIHCGANVKHYGKYKSFYEANVIGTKNILDFCKKSGAKLAHISTTSVGGFSHYNNINTLTEDTLYINQVFNNHVYMISKYLAEVEILNCINNNTVSGNIFRIGNMMPRIRDNKFQVNLYDNAFISRLKTLTDLKVICPEYKNIVFDITPVDLCSNAIVSILQDKKNNNQTIYHIYNNQQFTINDILTVLDIPITEISKKEMISKIIDANNSRYSHLLNDLKNSNILESRVVNDKTVKYLNNIKFYWPTLPDSYIRDLIKLY